MNAARHHFASHSFHMALCVAAMLLVFAAIALSVPVFAVFGAVFCGVMMIGMVWMMFSMARRGGH